MRVIFAFPAGPLPVEMSEEIVPLQGDRVINPASGELFSVRDRTYEISAYEAKIYLGLELLNV